VVIAQSMGGIIGVRLALQYPEHVSHLVLCATSGGLDMSAYNIIDWRREYRAEYPQAAEWIMTERPNHAPELGQLKAKTFLLWGDADPISPVSVGEHLAKLLPDARLHVVKGGDHAFARDRAPEIAPLIHSYIS
jgi:pimeloyl-ACP methyl ester carboxylesterase